MNSVLLLLVEVTAVFAVALLGVRLASRARAAVRHLILASAFGVVLLLPLATLVSPSVVVEISGLPAREAAQISASEATSIPVVSEPIDGQPSNVATTAPARITVTPPASARPIPAATWLLLIWAVVALITLAPVAVSLSHLRSIRRRGHPWPEGTARMNELARAAGMQPPVVVVHEIAGPITTGVLSPVIVLPSSAVTWSETHVANALVHELEHVRRHDWLVHMTTRTVCALYWFHPLAWLAWRVLRLAAEQACDDAVLAREDAATYAEQLLGLARHLAHKPAPGLSMANGSDLSTRVRSILDNMRPRGRAGNVVIAGMVLAAILAVAALAPLRATGPLRKTAAPTSAAGAAQVTVSGHVRDESGAPVAGANVQLFVPTNDPARTVRVAVVTDRNGTFSASVPRLPRVSITAAHPDYGLQWTASVGITTPAWVGYQWAGPISEAPVDLVLRRGVVLRGRVVDVDNRPFGREAIFLQPSYIGSSPSEIKAFTDSDGRFEFERAVLSQFELVPRNLLTEWMPREAGEHLRFTQAPASWLATAQSGGSLDLRVERYRLVPVSINVSALKAKSVQVWKRWGTTYSGTSMQPDESGTVQLLMEQGVEHELWVFPGDGTNLSPPWARGVQRNWQVTPNGPVSLKLSGEIAGELGVTKAPGVDLKQPVRNPEPRRIPSSPTSGAQKTGTSAIDPANVAFGYTDGTGTKLLALPGRDDSKLDNTIDMAFANTLVTAVCSEGQVLPIHYLRKQQGSSASNGRQSDSNFANEDGQLFEVTTGHAEPDDTCMLVPANYLVAYPIVRNEFSKTQREAGESAYWRAIAAGGYDKLPTDVFGYQIASDFARNSIKALEQAKGRKTKRYWLLHRNGRPQEVATIEFAPEGDSLLGSLVLVEPGRLSFLDMPASLKKGRADSGCWRVDDDCHFGAAGAGTSVPAVLGNPSKQLIVYTSDGAEGQVILLLQVKDGALVVLKRAYRYRSPI